MALVASTILLALFLVSRSTEACKPCYMVNCKDTSSSCKAGVVKDICGCCDVCAKPEAANCGGLFNFHGKCGKGLNCVSRRPNAVKHLGENDYISGTCEPSACINKKCGFNQKCQLNQRGKARCMCPRFCKTRYVPVCGLTNGRHYWNRCFLRRDECKIQQRIGYIDGPCKNCYEKGKAYKFGDEINRKDKCEICTCVHGNWRCVQDFDCQSESEMPRFCHVKDNDCPSGTYCQLGKYEPAFAPMDIGLGICAPKDERPTDQQGSEVKKCPQLKCAHCRHGYQRDSQGCSTCDCNKGSTKNVCSRPKLVGACGQKIPRYYHNAEKGKCIVFSYSGCLSNGNNFATRMKCEMHCLVRK